MVLKGKEFDKDNATQKLAKEQRKVRIAQDKQRARVWPENRRLRRLPLVVAREVTELPTEVSSQEYTGQQGIQQASIQEPVQQVITDPLAVLVTLENRRQALLQEADEIQSAIQVIKRTLSYETHLQEPTGRRTSRS